MRPGRYLWLLLPCLALFGAQKASAQVYDQVIEFALPQANGSYVWSAPEDQGQDEDSNLIGSLEDSFYISGGTGMATIYSPVTATADSSTELFVGNTVIPNAGTPIREADIDIFVGAGTGFGIDFNGATQGNHIVESFDETFTIPYNTWVDFFYQITTEMAINPADSDFSTCGTPGPNNNECIRGGAVDMEIGVQGDGKYYIPQGATLIDGSGNPISVVNVPEPSDYALMLAGLGLLRVVARRRKG